MYKSLVWPQLDYCTQAWRPHLQKDIDVLEKVQRRATKMIKECKGMEYAERLKVTKLTTLKTRRIRADLIEVYKIIKGMEGLKKKKISLSELIEQGLGHNPAVPVQPEAMCLNYIKKFQVGHCQVQLW